jgi:hypothetical protein
MFPKLTVTTVDFEPLSVAVPLREEPPGVFRVGNSRVLLELVVRAFQRGETPEGIVRIYRTLSLADVYAVISRFLVNPAPFDEYLRQCADREEALRARIEQFQTPGVTKDELLARAREKGVAQ